MEISQLKSDRGVLFMLSSHLGDQRDIPQRSLNLLREADLLVFEEDRPARKALKAAGVHRPYLKYSEHDQRDTLAEVRSSLKSGLTVAYMSDQGCPSLADPGGGVLKVAYEMQANIRVIPGPSAITAALSACPFVVQTFFYAGFPPMESKKRLKAVKHWLTLQQAVIMLDAPYRLAKLLDELRSVLPSKRQVFLALDISGPQESYYCGNTGNIIEQLGPLKGKKINFVLIISSG